MEKEIEESPTEIQISDSDSSERHNSSVKSAKNVTEEVSSNSKTTSVKSRIPIYAVIVILLLATIAGLYYWIYYRKYETTDDAFIESDIVQISPKVSAFVTKVHVKDNQLVKKGDLLVELDSRDLEAKLANAQAHQQVAQAQRGKTLANVNLTRKTSNADQNQARSNVETARVNVEQMRVASNAKQNAIRQANTQVKTAQASLAQAEAQIPAAESSVRLAQADVNRYQELFNQGDIAEQRLQQAVTALQIAQAQLNVARKQAEAEKSKVNEAKAKVTIAEDEYQNSLAQIELSKSQVNESSGRLQEASTAPQRIAVDESETTTAEAQIQQANTAVEQAQLELSYTKIYAPEDGFISRRNVQEGQLVQAGMNLMAISRPNVWVIANFKETQFELMHIGQQVEIKIDAYPNRVFYGKVDSFQMGTGSRFSVLPAENASGNYVKVVQRVPVKITFDEKPENVHLLVPGMSVQPKVRVR